MENKPDKSQARWKTYFWDLDLVSLLEVLGKSLNKVFGWNILDGDSVVCVQNSSLNLDAGLRFSVLLTSIFVLAEFLV